MMALYLDVEPPAEHHTYYVDGGNLGPNPSPSGIYFSVGVERGSHPFEILAGRHKRVDYHTNNDAEFAAIEWALKHIMRTAGQEKPSSITICSDSEFAIKIVSGRTSSKIPRIQAWQTSLSLLQAAAEDAAGLWIAIQWVPREENVKRLGH